MNDEVNIAKKALFKWETYTKPEIYPTLSSFHPSSYFRGITQVWVYSKNSELSSFRLCFGKNLNVIANVNSPTAE